MTEIEPEAVTRHVAVWMLALEIQNDRIELEVTDLSAGLRREIDQRFFVVALRNLIRAAKQDQIRASAEIRARISKGLVEFDRAVPGVKDFRDVLEHFDDYEKGKGFLQAEGNTDPTITWFHEANGVHTIHIERAGLAETSITVQVALEAARRLVAEIPERLVDQ
jgi:hypothetical protein